jgi:hypothetical protein
VVEGETNMRWLEWPVLAMGVVLAAGCANGGPSQHFGNGVGRRVVHQDSGGVTQEQPDSGGFASGDDAGSAFATGDDAGDSFATGDDGAAPVGFTGDDGGSTDTACPITDYYATEALLTLVDLNPPYCPDNGVCPSPSDCCYGDPTLGGVCVAW